MRRSIIPSEQKPRTPHPSEPGTLGEQLAIIDLFLGDPSRKIDRDDAWDRARRLTLEHARRRDR